MVSLPVILAAAVCAFVLAVMAIRVWAHRSRLRPQRPVTEAEARAHASPLTRSVLAVTRQPRPRSAGRSDT